MGRLRIPSNLAITTFLDLTSMLPASRPSRVHDISSTTSTAVAEQRTATSEISSNVHQAAIATQEVAQNVAGMTRSVQQTSEAASMLLSSADKLTGEATGLNEVAGHFLQTIRGE